MVSGGLCSVAVEQFVQARGAAAQVDRQVRASDHTGIRGAGHEAGEASTEQA